MAEDTVKSISNQIDNMVGDEKPDAGSKPKYVPMYKMVGDSKIPVAKDMGKMWDARRKTAVSKRNSQNVEALWDQCIRYYRHDHLQTRGEKESSETTNPNLKGLDTENVVFSNVSALVPAIYAKNPDVEVSAEDLKHEDVARTCEKLINVIFRRKTSPGVNLKPKARKCVVSTTLTNLSWLEVGYTRKEDSSQNALIEINRIAQELEKAKDIKKIEELEGQLMALEKKVSLLHSSGPWVKFRRPHDVLIDPDAEDYGDAKWMMVCDYLPTDLLRAVYGEKKKDGQYHSVYNPTHVLKVDAKETTDDVVNNFSLFEKENNHHSNYGYDDQQVFESAQRTKVWYVWDKVTRRVLMFNDADWSWPIWVWNDPYNLDTFFPFFPLEFYTDPEDLHARSEVAYYLDQQDSINLINAEQRRWREWASSRFIYNKNQLDAAKVEQFLRDGSKERALGVEVPPETDVGNLFKPLLPPSVQVAQIFDKTPQLEAIDRLSSVTQVMRGTEYKTNTTNKAIESYESQTQTRLDEKIDAVEEHIGSVGWAILQLCVQFMSPEEVAELLGEEHAQLWAAFQGMPIQQFQQQFNFQVIGGSALKPTSASKKEQAIQISQAVGTFSSASPAAILVALKVLERAFDDVVITKEDWQMIQESIVSQLQRGNTSPEGSSSANSSGSPEQQGGSADGQQMLQQVEKTVDSLPPEIRQMLGDAIASGMPFRQAVAQVMEAVGGTQQPGR